MKEDTQEELEPSYSLTIAVEDFKQGVQLYQNKDLKAAYSLIRKALLKFQLEHQSKLILESTFLIANILFQLEKFNPAIKYFQELKIIALDLQHKKYLELSSFMLAFCQYKTRNYKKAFEIFESDLSDPIEYVNKLQLFTFRARTSSKLGYRDQSIQFFKEAIEICQKEQNGIQNEGQKAQLYNEIGLELYYKILDEIKASGLSYLNDLNQNSQAFSLSIEYFQKAIEIWEKHGETKKFITTIQIIGNIYGYLKNLKKQIEYYNIALQKSEEINEFEQYIKISRNLIRILTNLKNSNELISLLQRVISVLNQNGVSDIIAIAEFHLKLGKTLLSLKQINNALYEFITALNIYERLKNPISEHKTTLNLIIQIYRESEDIEKLSYYSQQLSILEERFNENTSPSDDWLVVIKDFWFITETGIEIFSYTPDVHINPTLFGGFISALQSLSEEISQKRMESFVIGNQRYSFYFEEGKPIFIIGRASIEELDTRVTKVLSVLYKRFFNEYGKFLVKFSGNVSPFQNFGEVMKTIDFNLV
ncbi:tetratricopeptide repeat protein [Promethearchaeum syntrophicum]|uniref:Tetratricopeptide repeat protein n=1 Tax=Promethearchaeum syntrophicum TaxID=2594042 RepID=A0A5B9D647_9ARCH|nr:hypothetical protein [Candidatus Prometheoarchaeum syntrophicum]